MFSRQHRFRIAGKRGEVEETYRVDPGYPEFDLGYVRWCDEPLATGDYYGCLVRYPRPYHLPVFMRIMDRLSDSEYWRLLGEIWIDAEVPNVNRPIWLDLFTAKRGERENLMLPGDRAAFAALPEDITLYRGAAPKYVRGMAWTTDRDRAVWFMQRYSGSNGAQLFTTRLPKTRLLAYFTERKESEAVIDPRRIRYEAASPQEVE